MTSVKFFNDFSVILIGSECFFLSIMHGVTLLVLVFMWCTQTVHTQEGQWTVFDNYTLHIRAITPKIGTSSNGEGLRFKG